MASGLQATFELLTKTPNEAAVAVLIPALESPRADIQEGALRSILDRRSQAGQGAVLKRLHRASEGWKAIIHERRGRLSQALRDAVLGQDEQSFANACQGALWFHEYDVIPALVTVAEGEAQAHGDRAAQTILRLCEALYEEIATPRDYTNRRDPQALRQFVAGSLEGSVRRYGKHRRVEVIEGFLLLAARDNAALKQWLREPQSPVFEPLVQVLEHSPRGGIMRLLLSYLEDLHAPAAALELIGRRRDAKFVRHLLHRIGEEPSAAAAQNLKRVTQLAWVVDDRDMILNMDDASQHSAVQVVRAASLGRRERLAFLEFVIRQGKPAGRRAAVRGLVDFVGSEANALVLSSLDDPDPGVQAEAVGQLRQRGVPNALRRLIEALDHPDLQVRDAARASLQEFSFPRFLAAFDTLDEVVRQSTGRLVYKVDAQAAELVSAELHSQARTRRLRALAVAMAMDCVPAIEAVVCQLLIEDDDHLVRQEAAVALAGVATPGAIQTLRQALKDRSPTVRDAAQDSLRAVAAAQAEKAPSAPPLSARALTAPVDAPVAIPSGPEVFDG